MFASHKDHAGTRLTFCSALSWLNISLRGNMPRKFTAQHRVRRVFYNSGSKTGDSNPAVEEYHNTFRKRRAYSSAYTLYMAIYKCMYMQYDDAFIKFCFKYIMLLVWND